MYMRYVFKIISMLLAIVFTFNTVCYPSSSSVYSISIPEKSGKVIARWDPSFSFDRDKTLSAHSDFSVIVIEDAHDNFTAQENLSDIIQNVTPLVRDSDFVVGVEGASGIIDYEHLRRYPLRAVRETASKDLVRRGYLGGAEHALVSGAQSFEMFGVEDEELFIENFQLHYALGKQKKYIQEILTQINHVLSAQKTEYFSPGLLEFESQYERYSTGIIDLFEFAHIVDSYSDIVRDSIAEYPMMALFSECTQTWDTADQAELKKELESICTAETQSPQTLSDEEILHLSTEVKNKNDFPYLMQKAAAIRKYRMIDIQTLIEEFERAAYAIKKQLAEKQIEQQLVDSDLLLRTIEKVITLRATRYDILTLKRVLRKDPCSVEKLLCSYFPQSISIDLYRFEELFDDACRFYELAQQREQAMCANLLSRMRRNKKSLGVLVAGGFHSKGIIRILQEQNIPYMLVRTTVNSAIDPTGFHTRMMGELLPLAPVYTSYIPSRSITGLVEMLCGEYGQEELYKAFDLEWTETIVNSQEFAALLYLLKDDESLEPQLRYRIRSLFQVAHSIAHDVQTEGGSTVALDLNEWQERLRNASLEEARVHKLVKILELSELESSSYVGRDIGSESSSSLAVGEPRESFTYASTDYMQRSQIGNDAYVKNVSKDKNGDFRADIHEFPTGKVMEKNMRLMRVPLKKPFLSALRKLPDNPVVLAFQKCAQSREAKHLPELYTFDKELGDLNAFVWEPKNLIAVDRILYANHAARPLLLFHEFGHYLIDRNSAGKETNKMQIECVEEDGAIILNVNVWYQVYDPKSKMTINTAQMIPVELSVETIEFIYAEKGAVEREWMEWDQDPHYLLRTLQYELFHTSGDGPSASTYGLDQGFTQQIRTNIRKRRLHKLGSVQKKIERLIHAINSHQYSREKWADVRLKLEKQIKDIEHERSALSESIPIEDEDGLKSDIVERTTPTVDELLERGIYLARPQASDIRTPEEVIRDLTRQIDLLGLYCEAQIRGGADPKELYLEESIISELGALIRSIDLHNSSGNERLDEILRLKPYKRKNKIIEKLLRQSTISPQLIDNQSVAMEMMVNTPLSLTHGTVAGGKSQTIVEAVKNILEEDGSKPVLVISPQHKSTDELTERLFSESEYPIARLGYDPMRFAPFVREQCTLEWARGNGYENFQWRWDKVNTPFSTQKSVYLATHMGAFFELRKMFRDETFKRKIQNSVLIIDEAALINYPEFLILLFLVKPSAVHVIGDHKQFNTFELTAQLSPIARGYFLSEMTPDRRHALDRYQESVFEELSTSPVYKTRLRVNFRCHKTIVEMIDYFYDDISLIPYDDESPQEDTLQCFDTSDLAVAAIEEKTLVYDDETGERHQSYQNVFEARMIVDKIDTFLQKKRLDPELYTAARISVLTPYQGQADLIKRCIDEDNRFSVDEKKVLKENVSTIRKVQGAENDIVLISFVRSEIQPPVQFQTQRRSGIVSDSSLLLVALSRMKKKLFFVGNKRVLNDYVKSAKDPLVRGMYEHVFSFAEKVASSFAPTPIQDAVEEPRKDIPRISVEPGEISCSAYSLRRFIAAGSVAIEAALAEKFQLPSAVDGQRFINRDYARPIEFFPRVSKGRNVWVIQETDLAILLEALGLPVRSEQGSESPPASDGSIKEPDVPEPRPVQTKVYDARLEAILQKMQKIDEDAFPFGLRGKRVPYKKAQLKKDFARMLSESFEPDIADEVANTLCRMERGSLEILQAAGVLTEKEKDIFLQNRPTVLRRLARADKAHLREQLNDIVQSFSASEGETHEMLKEILLPFELVEYFTKRVEKSFYNQDSLALMLDTLTGLPSFILNDPDDLHHELYVAMAEEEEYFGRAEDDIRRIGKKVEPEPSTFRRSLKTNSARISVYDHAEGHTHSLSLWEDRIDDVSKYIFERPIKGSLEIRSIVSSFVREFQESIDRSDVSFYTFKRDHAFIKDLFGFAFTRRRGIARDVIAYYEGFKRNRVVLFHEIAEYLIKKDAHRVYEMQAVLDDEARAWVDAHVEKNSVGKELGYTEEQNVRNHYIIRAFSRSVFGIEDAEVTEQIKDEMMRLDDAASYESRQEEEPLRPVIIPRIIRGPYVIDGQTLYAESVPTSKIDSVLDAWFEAGEKRYFSRDLWSSYVNMNRENDRQDFLHRIVTEDGSVVALAYFHKGVFDFDGIDRITYVDDLREVAASYRGKGVGKILLAKTIFTVMHDPEIIADDVFIVHPAEDAGYADEDRRARHFFEQNRFHRLYLTAYQERTQDDHGVDEFYSISRGNAYEFLQNFDSNRTSLLPRPPIQLELFEQYGKSEDNTFVAGTDPFLEIEFENGTFRDEYVRIIRELYEVSVMRYFKSIILQEETRIKRFIVTKSFGIIDKTDEGDLIISEKSLEKCLFPGHEGEQAQRDLLTWILPSVIYRHSPSMRKTIDRAADVFWRDLQREAQKKDISTERAEVISIFGADQHKKTVARFIEMIYWRLMPLITDDYADDVDSGVQLSEQLMALVKEFSQTNDSEVFSPEVLDAFMRLAIKDPMTLWRALIVPLGSIHSFIEDQGFDYVLQTATFDTLQTYFPTEDFNEFYQVAEMLHKVIKDGRSLDIYVDEKLSQTQMYSAVQEIIDAGVYAYGPLLDVRIRLLSERDEHTKRPELILALEDTQVIGDTIFWFSKEPSAFAFDVYIFGLFFDAMVYKGIVLHEGNTLVGDWLNKIGNISFHAHLKESFEPAVKDYITVRIFRAAA